MHDAKTWWIGVSLIVTFILMGELAMLFREYLYSRLGLSRDLILSVLWLLPIIASFIVVYHSNKKKVLKGFSLIIVLSVLGPLVHFLSGQLGVTIDFSGFPGMKVTFQVYFILGVLTIGFGVVVGVLFNKRR
jgi:hypothetical protein